MARSDEKIVKYPSLRNDLKISKQVFSENISYVVKDPLKGEYYRFDQTEWDMISQFDGQLTIPEMVDRYQKKHFGRVVSVEDFKNFQESLNSIHLLEKPKKEQNIMLMEKMKEHRKSLLLSKKGSLMYKRFPILDPDQLFNRVLPYLSFFWTRWFFIFSTICIGFMFFIISTHLREFHEGIRDIFTFSNHSFWSLTALWVTIYLTIAVHELGHGLTCKYYGGEVHEIGLLVMFMQPCLYANVNDAWLFDKKWKQIMVTLAGGFIELWIGSIFAFLWLCSNPLTFLNVLSFQVVTICTAATILANFNPLVKLDGYYLLSDYLEAPNLRDNAFKYLKYLFARYVFQKNGQEFSATRREREIYFIYSSLSFFWVTGTMLGLFFLAKGFLEEHFHELGVLFSFWVGYKLFKGYIVKSLKFIAEWYMEKRAFFKDFFKNPKDRKVILVGSVAAGIVIFLVFVPVPYSVPGHCDLEPSFIHVIRAESDGFLQKFILHDGATIRTGDLVANMMNESTVFDQKISHLAVNKVQAQLRQAIGQNTADLVPLKKELLVKEAELEKKNRALAGLDINYLSNEKEKTLLSCADEEKKTQTYVKKGDEICRAIGFETLRAVIQVSETHVRFIREKDAVEFKLRYAPFSSFAGTVHRLKQVGTPNPVNPKERTYHAEIIIQNDGKLRPGMTGMAKIIAKKVPIVTQLFRKLSAFFRMDLFF